MSKTVKRAISLLLVAVLLVGTFSGCIKSNKEEEAAITATSIKFTKSGQYTTTVTSKKFDLSSIAADNIEVKYADPNSNAVIEEGFSEDMSETELIDTLYSLKAKVDSVSENSSGGYDISFTDDKAAELTPGDYLIVFKSISDSNAYTYVDVDFPEITVTSDIEFVTAEDKETKVTLTLDGSEYTDSVTADQIVLGNAFSDMQVASVSASDKNLTVQLTGTPVQNSVGAYQWGTVGVKPAALKDGYQNVTTQINIIPAINYLDSETLKFESGKIIADLKVYNFDDISSLTNNNIKIDGVTVETAEKADDNTVKLTISADGVKNVNDFAALVSGKTLTLGENVSDISLAPASFYPVFDYVGEDGDNLQMTMILYANNGTFAPELKADAVSLDSGFKGGKVDEIKVDTDTTATLNITVPANGQNADDLNIEGEIILSAGSLISNWGDPTSTESRHTREYNNEGLGRDVPVGSNVTLNTATLLEIQKYTRGLDTVFGSICYYGQAAGAVYGLVKSILEATGVLESEHEQVMKALSQLSKKLDQVFEYIEVVRQDIVKVQSLSVQNMLVLYNTQLELLDSTTDTLNRIYEKAKKDLAREDSKYANVKLDQLTDDEAAEYSHAVTDYILSRTGAGHETDTNYGDFINTFNTFIDCYREICKQVARKTSDNPISLYDESCALNYNFDSECYAFRVAQREYVRSLLVKAYAVIALRYDAVNDPDNPNMEAAIELFKNAINRLDDLDKLVGPAPEDVDMESNNPNLYPYSYVFGYRVKLDYAKEKTAAAAAKAYGNNTNKSNRAITMPDGSQRDWTLHEKTSFISRTNGKSIKENLAAAGFEQKYQLAYKVEFAYALFMPAFSASYYDMDSNQEKSGESGIQFIAYSTAGPYNPFYVVKCYDSLPVGDLSYRAYVQDKGWMDWVTPQGDETALAGTTSESKRLEALSIFLTDIHNKAMLSFRSYVQDKGWMDWVDSDGSQTGTTEQGKRMEAIEIKLKDDFTETYNICYRVYMQDKGWGDWVMNGQTAGTTGESRRIEAIEIKLEEKQ